MPLVPWEQKKTPPAPSTTSPGNKEIRERQRSASGRARVVGPAQAFSALPRAQSSEKKGDKMPLGRQAARASLVSPLKSRRDARFQTDVGCLLGDGHKPKRSCSVTTGPSARAGGPGTPVMEHELGHPRAVCPARWEKPWSGRNPCSP